MAKRASLANRQLSRRLRTFAGLRPSARSIADASKLVSSAAGDRPLYRAEQSCELRTSIHRGRISRLIVGLEPTNRGGNCVELLRIEIHDSVDQKSGDLFKVVQLSNFFEA
jgi:hypothetical protein